LPHVVFEFAVLLYSVCFLKAMDAAPNLVFMAGNIVF
jgi:hypothetical protein